MNSQLASEQLGPRLLEVLCQPLPHAPLVLTQVNVHEEMSAPYLYQLTLFAEQVDIGKEDLLGLPVSFRINQGVDRPRLFHGYICKAVVGKLSCRGLQRVQLTVVPTWWYLKHSCDYRIFSQQTVPQIVTTLLSEMGLQDIDMRTLQQDYPVRRYTTQYNESLFDFISRLLEEVGIGYYFRHEIDRHIMVFCDQKTRFLTYPMTMQYRLDAPQEYHLSSWRQDFNWMPTTMTLCDYDMSRSNQGLSYSLATAVQQAASVSLEVREYLAKGVTPSALCKLTQQRVNQENLQQMCLRASGNYLNLSPGLRVNIGKDQQTQAFILTTVRYQVKDNSGFNHINGATADRPQQVTHQFVAVSAGMPYCPKRKTALPKAYSETAKVVTPNKQESHTHTQGQVTLQFHWERHANNAAAQCRWVRVSQARAGQGDGHQWLPQIGQEVLVRYRNGDPDQPMVVGALYNDANRPPLHLPAEKNNSIFQQKGNSLQFYDRFQHEKLRLVASRDFVKQVQNNQSLVVENEIELIVGGDFLTDIKAGKYQSQAKQRILLQAGGSGIEITAKGITLQGDIKQGK